MWKYILALLLWTFQAQGFDIDGNWLVDSGSLTYHVHFTLKEVTGKSTLVKGKGLCKKSTCEFLFAAPVKSFDSGDTNRDMHMIEVTKGALHPMVVVKLKVDAKEMQKNGRVNLGVEFAGKAKSYHQVAVKLDQVGSQLKATGVLPILLSDFSVERPSLLGLKIDDNVEVDFNILLSSAKD